MKPSVKTTTYADLSQTIRHSSDVTAWLEGYERLNPEGKRAARQSRDTYCRHNGLTCISVLSCHGELEGGFIAGEFDLEAASVCAAFFADIKTKTARGGRV